MKLILTLNSIQGNSGFRVEIEGEQRSIFLDVSFIQQNMALGWETLNTMHFIYLHHEIFLLWEVMEKLLLNLLKNSNGFILRDISIFSALTLFDTVVILPALGLLTVMLTRWHNQK